MGNCCVGSTAKESHQDSIRRSLPPTLPLPEEETVKEVLSETPAIPKNSPPILPNGPHPPKFSPPEEPNKPPAVLGFGSGEFFSPEIRGSVSMTATDKRDCEGVAGDVRMWSPARVQKRALPDTAVGRSPSRRSDPFPGRVRSGPGMDPGHGSSGNVIRRENGESSGRRSRSPVMQSDTGNARAGLGRSPSARNTGKYMDRVRSELGDSNRRLDESNAGSDDKEKWGLTNSNESLENPLVSLECFIFL